MDKERAEAIKANINKIREFFDDETRAGKLLAAGIPKDDLLEFADSLDDIFTGIELEKVRSYEPPEGLPYMPTGLFSRPKTPLVKVRPVGEEYKDKTYLGIYVGEIALSSSASIQEDRIVTKHGMFNPAIYVPELKRIIFGIESWWGAIESADDLREITDELIKDQPYIKAIVEMLKPKEQQDGNAS